MIIVLLILLIGYIVVVSHDTWWGVSNGRGNTTFDEITSDQITNNLISGGSVVVKAPPNYQPYYHRVLDNLDREEYGKTPDYTFITLHLGQRKLLCTEVEFLTKFGGVSETVVYAGAAPGHHTVLLAMMFPNYQFELYDPAQFNPKLATMRNVKVYNEYFTDAIASKYVRANATRDADAPASTPADAPRDVLFICDIRTGTVGIAEEDIPANMEQQRVWVKLMKPRMASLKFRLPWAPGTTKYFDGEIYLQQWEGRLSAETRLITDGTRDRMYDNVEYEQKNFHFQRSRRSAWHKHDIVKEGIDHCYDCWSEIGIIKEYLAESGRFLKTAIPPTNENISHYIDLFTKYTQRDPNTPPHGMYPDIRDTNARIQLLRPITTEYLDKKRVIEDTYKHSKSPTHLKQVKGFETVDVVADAIADANAIAVADADANANGDTATESLSSNCPDPQLITTTPSPYITEYPEIPIRTFKPEERRGYTSMHRGNALVFIDFMNKWGNLGGAVVVIGLAPAIEMVLLSGLFPEHNFVIYDPRPIYSGIKGLDNVVVRQKYFTNNHAHNIVHEAKLIICGVDLGESTANIVAEWMKGIAGLERALIMVKLDNGMDLYRGDLIIPPWSSMDTPHMWLSTNCKTPHKYDAATLRRQWYAFQTRGRHRIQSAVSTPQTSTPQTSTPQTSSPSSPLSPSSPTAPKCKGADCIGCGYDECYDCWREYSILGAYISKPHTHHTHAPTTTTPTTTPATITDLCALLSTTTMSKIPPNHNCKPFADKLKMPNNPKYPNWNLNDYVAENEVQSFTTITYGGDE